MVAMVNCILGLLLGHSAFKLIDAFTRGFGIPSSRKTYSELSAYYLNSALESLADQRGWTNSAYHNVHFLDPTETTTTDDDNTRSMPLYPLNAVYIPHTGVNHTLNNVERRNVQMALDLVSTQIEGYFCATPACMDTGKLSTMGTLMKAIDIQPIQDATTGEILRVIVTCEPVETVVICCIENPATPSSRLQQPSEYLRAKVKSRTDMDDCTLSVHDENNGELKRLRTELTQVYNHVRNLYIQGNGAQDLPRFSIDKLSQSLPFLNHGNFTRNELWKVAQIWQTLCYTIREGRQIQLSSDRNELMVASAIKKGGALKLPIRIDDLDPVDRRRVEELELAAHHEWIGLELDPCLDLLVFISLSSYENRLTFLGDLIIRERKRLEQAALLQPHEDTVNKLLPTPRKGAWFEG
jgi:hypothetical protein